MAKLIGADSKFIEPVRLTSNTLALVTPVTFNIHVYTDGSVRDDGNGLHDSIDVYFPNVLTGAPNWGHCTQFDCTGGNVVNAKIGHILTFGAEIRLAATVAIDSAALAERPGFWTDSSFGGITIDASDTGGEWVSDFTPGSSLPVAAALTTPPTQPSLPYRNQAPRVAICRARADGRLGTTPQCVRWPGLRSKLKPPVDAQLLQPKLATGKRIFGHASIGVLHAR